MPEPAATTSSPGRVLSYRSEVEAVWLLLGSTGAGAALQEFLNYFKEPPSIAFIYAQHYDPQRQDHLDELTLENDCFSLHLADACYSLQAGQVLIVPPATKINITECGQLMPLAEAWNNRYTPDFNQLLSMFSMAGLPAPGIIFLSGMGDDGASALDAVDVSRCRIWAQDPASAICGAMPQAAIDSGRVQLIGSPVALAASLERSCQQ